MNFFRTRTKIKRGDYDMDIVIRKADREDAAEILQYLNKVGGETDNLTFGSEGVPFTIEMEEDFISQIENSCDSVMLLATESGRIVGNASLNRLPRRMSHRGDFAVSVLKEYWNKGIGGRLLEEIIAFAKENCFEVIDLQVRCDNVSAIHLYEKYGFEKIGTHPAFFKINGEEIAFDYMYLRIR